MGKPTQQTKHYVAPVIRGAFLKALDIMCQAEGKTHSQLMVDLIEQEGLLAVMDRVAKFAERTSEATLRHEGEVNLVSILQSIAPGAVYDIEVESEPGTVRH